MIFDVYSCTDTGGQKINEDYYASSFDGEKGLFVVADGLGGHQKGDLASREVCKMFLSAWQEPGECDLSEWFKKQAEEVNEHLLTLQDSMQCIMKSTIVALAIQKEEACWMNVGDSRLYHYHKGDLSSVTKDQSMAYMKYKAGEIAYEDIAKDEDQCVLLSALGNARRHKPHIYETFPKVSRGDAFLLCTDGAWTYLTREEIKASLIGAKDAKTWGAQLLQIIQTKLEDNSDNFTFLIIMIH